MPLGEGEFRLSFFDVGQGLAVAIVTRNSLVLYDFGPGGKNFAPASIPIWNLLADRRMDAPTLSVASHAARDHVGGRDAINRLMKPANLLSGEPEKTGGDQCKRPFAMVLDRVEFKFLNDAKPPSQQPNNRSCVLLILGRYGSALLTGDIENKGEQAIIAAMKKRTTINVLQVPHHGSKTSSSRAFLEHIQPDVAVLSRGIQNQYGHPNDQVMARYARSGIRVLDTALEGQIDLSSTKKGWIHETFKEKNLRFWHW